MPTNPFDDLNSLAPSQNYSQKNPFDDLYEQENKEREKKLKQILNTVSSLDPDNTGEAQKLANRLNLPAGVALNSDTTLEILRERNKRQNIYFRKGNNLRVSYFHLRPLPFLTTSL